MLVLSSLGLEAPLYCIFVLPKSFVNNWVKCTPLWRWTGVFHLFGSRQDSFSMTVFILIAMGYFFSSKGI